MRKTVLTLIVALAAIQAFAQDGFIRGKILEEATGEPLFGATVVKKGTTVGTSTDFDGNYSVKLPVGVHDIVFQSVSFQSVVIEGVEVKAGEATILDIVMKEDVQQLGEVVVTATVAKDNEIGVMLVQRKSVNTLDGISSTTFRKVGDSNLSSAMKRVTGVSIQGDKYVYVRGLGDRYTLTSVNGMIIPGLDPDRNDVQIDIFPTGILENVLVYKTFTPNLPGSFTGGLVDIQTKAFPEKESTSVSVSLGYNPSMHFKKDYLTYDGSSTDWLGFDDGTRDLPVDPNVGLGASPENTNKFDPTLGGSRKMSLMNGSLSFSHRNQIIGKKLTWGYNALFTYRNRTNYYADFERQQYQRDKTGSEISLEQDYRAIGDLASNEVLWSGLASIAAKSANTTIGTTFINIQNGQSQSLKRTRRNSSLNNPAFIYNDVLSYTERHMFNNITYGKHHLGNLNINWTNSLIFSRQYEPDYRETGINREDGEYAFRNGGKMNRFWRELNELNESFKLDFELEANDKNTVKFGGSVNYRDRDFDVYSYTYFNLASDNVDSSDPNDLQNHLISDTNPDGLYIDNGTRKANLYEGNQTIFGAYVMNEMKIGERLKSVYGVRMENVAMYYKGIVDDVEVDDKTLSETNFLPALSLIYNLSETMNLRGSFSKTLARPSFREKSGAYIDDPITGLTFIGNIDVKQAEILNYDLRWENFFKAGEMVSASVFYKDFTNHIALVAFDVAPGQLTPRNVGSAVAYGAELEARKNLGFINPVFSNFSAGGNFTYTISRVDRKTVKVGETTVDQEVNGETQQVLVDVNEYESDVKFNNGDASNVERYRNMSMQAPFSVNAFVNYETTAQDWTANISYNVQGETLTYVSASYVPEVYTKPFHSLNFKVSRNFGAEQNQSVSLRIQNIINDNNELVYKTATETEPFSLRQPGRTFTVSYRYSF